MIYTWINILWTTATPITSGRSHYFWYLCRAPPLAQLQALHKPSRVLCGRKRSPTSHPWVRKSRPQSYYFTSLLSKGTNKRWVCLSLQSVHFLVVCPPASSNTRAIHWGCTDKRAPWCPSCSTQQWPAPPRALWEESLWILVSSSFSSLSRKLYSTLNI